MGRGARVCALAVSTIAEASVVEAEGRLVWGGQIFAAGKLRSDRLDDLFDLGVRFHRPLLGGFCLCLRLLETPLCCERLTNCTVYDARYFRAAQALGVSSATRLNGKSATPRSTEAR